MPDVLKPMDFLILLSLLEEERHGYGIRQDVLQATEGAVALDAGNLYRSIRRLLEAGLLARSGRRPTQKAREPEDERRVFYRLTPEGRRALSAEAHRMKSLLKLGKVRRLLSEATP